MITDILKLTRDSEHHLTDECIRAVEAFDTFEGMPEHDAISVIGVLSGIKPVAFEDALQNPDDQATLESLLDQMGIIHRIMTIKGDDYIAMSLDVRLLDEFTELFPRACFEEDVERYAQLQRRVGTLLGYPLSATEFFIERSVHFDETGEWFDTAEGEGFTAENGLDTFTQLVLSPDYVDEEVAQYCEPLRQVVETLTPGLYTRILEAAEVAND